MTEVRLSENNSSLNAKLRSWKCLQELGYKFSHVTHSTLPSGSKVIGFLFENVSANRIVEISYNNSFGVASVFIGNTRVHYDFGVEHWLEYHSGELPEDLSLKRYQQIILNKHQTGVEPVLIFLEKLFLGPLKAVLSGEVWEVIHWHDKYR